MFESVSLGIFISGIFILLGLFVIFKESKKETKRAANYIFGIYVIMIGVLAISMGLLFGREVLTGIFGIGLCIGLVFVGADRVYTRIRCTHSVYAEYIDCIKTGTHKGRTYYSPVFRLYSGGKEYECRCLDNYSEKRISEKYEKNKEYPIYFSSQNPHVCIEDKKLVFSDILIIIIGIVLAVKLYFNIFI